MLSLDCTCTNDLCQFKCFELWKALYDEQICHELNIFAIWWKAYIDEKFCSNVEYKNTIVEKLHEIVEEYTV